MEMYKNDYLKKEDEALWELHEARHNLHLKIESLPIKELNKNALKKFLVWKKTYSKEISLK